MTKSATSRLMDHVVFTRSLLLLRSAPPAEELLSDLKAAKLCIDASHSESAPDVLLGSRMRLSQAEIATLILLACGAIDKSIREFLEANACTAELIRDLVYGPGQALESERALGPRSILRRLGLIERNDGGGAETHAAKQTWTLSRRMLMWLQGDENLDDELSGFVRESADSSVAQLIVNETVSVQALETGRTTGTVVIATGTPGLGRRSLLRAAAKEAGVELLEIDAKRLAKNLPELTKQLRMIARE